MGTSSPSLLELLRQARDAERDLAVALGRALRATYGHPVSDRLERRSFQVSLGVRLLDARLRETGGAAADDRSADTRASGDHGVADLDAGRLPILRKLEIVPTAQADAETAALARLLEAQTGPAMPRLARSGPRHRPGPRPARSPAGGDPVGR